MRKAICRQFSNLLYCVIIDQKDPSIKIINNDKLMNLKTKIIMISVMSATTSVSVAANSPWQTGKYPEHYLNAYDTLLKKGSLRGASFLGGLGVLLVPYTYYMKPKYTNIHYACAGLGTLVSLWKFTQATYGIAKTVHRKVTGDWSSALNIATSLTIRHCCGLPILNSKGETLRDTITPLKSTITRLELEISDLRTKKDSAESLASEKHFKSYALGVACDTLRLEKFELWKKYELLESNINTLEFDKEREKKIADQRQQEISRLDSRIKDLRESRDKFQSAAATRGEEIEQLKGSNKKLSDGAQLSKQAFDKERKTLIDQIERLEKQVQSLRNSQKEGEPGLNVTQTIYPREGVPSSTSSHSSSISSVLNSTSLLDPIQPGLSNYHHNLACHECIMKCTSCSKNFSPITTMQGYGKYRCSHITCSHKVQ
jgi:hypothetical protein